MFDKKNNNMETEKKLIDNGQWVNDIPNWKSHKKRMRHTVRVDRKRAEGTLAARICGYFLSCLKRVFTGTYTRKGWAHRERFKDWGHNIKDNRPSDQLQSMQLKSSKRWTQIKYHFSIPWSNVQFAHNIYTYECDACKFPLQKDVSLGMLA